MQSSVYVFLDKIDVEEILQVTWICVKQSFPNHDNYTAMIESAVILLHNFGFKSSSREDVCQYRQIVKYSMTKL